MTCSILDRLPTWRREGPWPYEFGVAALILWLAEAVRNLEDVRARYIVTFAMWDWVDDCPNFYISLLWVIALSIIVGFGARHLCPRCAIVMRAGGVSAAGGVFGIIAFHFLTAYLYSIGGGAYLFLCWRAFAVAAAIWRRHRRLFRAVKSPA